MFDKAWRVEDPNTFGTDEYIKMCRKIGCEPYICTNAGTGTEEEMGDWVEYCNLEDEGEFAKWRIQNGHQSPYHVKYWSIGNENYGDWEIGTKTAQEWGRLVCESAKIIKHVDPEVELTAAALTDLDWNINILQNSAQFLDWLSIHKYWDRIHQTNDYANYDQVMSYTENLSDSVDKVRGLLMAMGLQNKIKIAFDEWNLRGWYHPNIGHHTPIISSKKEEYLYPRDKNDDNSKYTMADAVFNACFLNMCNRNCDIVGMANFAPIVNTRGCIFTHKNGIVLRPTYHVFDLYVNYLGENILDIWQEESPKMASHDKSGKTIMVDQIDLIATQKSEEDVVRLAVVNKSADQKQEISFEIENGFVPQEYRCHTLSGISTESYNDINHSEVKIETSKWKKIDSSLIIEFPAHSITVIEIK